ncbi:MAG: methionine aminotransferase [Candidatus Competibacteraceae bacterium]|nr:methionine aminotransferase [Candidatus Competibacteraceae bacterium]
MTPALHSKLPRVGTTIFTVMSQLADEHGALNLSQGFPDFAAHPQLLESVYRQMTLGHNQYAPMAGVAALREAIAEKNGALYGYTANPATEITVTPGATAALFAAIQASVGPGDEVIVFDPAYDAYEPAVTLAGGRTLHLPLSLPDFTVDWQRLRETITPRTRMIVINSPHNPSGTLWSRADLETLAAIVADTEILILSDEVYEHILFDGRRHHSVLSHEPLRERSFMVSSFGKTYHVTGWKIGYCIAPPPLTQALRKVHQYVTFSTSTPMQYALAEFMAHREHYLTLGDFYQAKRDLFCRLLEGSRFSFTPARGTYFQLLDYSAITQEDDRDYALRLIGEAGIAAIPLSPLYKQPPPMQLLRFCFAKEDATLERGAEILCRL